jgi:CIC family chloride channel protein
VLPGVIGGGYGWIQAAIDGKLSEGTMLLLTFGMIVALSMTISSGGSGGVFAPSLFVGAMLGGFLGSVLHQPITTPFVIVGMTAVFAAAGRVPIAAMLMVVEMTGSYNLLAPAALAVMISYILQVNLSSRLKYNSLYEKQVPSFSDSPAHQEEQLEFIVKLFSEEGYSVPSSVSHLDLRKLLLTGMQIDLPDNRQIILLTVQPDSQGVNQTMVSLCSRDRLEEVEVVAGFRKGHLLLPNSEQKLQAGDRLLAIVSQAGRERLVQFITKNSNTSG